MATQYRPLCGRCKVYPASLSDGERCWRCRVDEQQEAEGLQREAAQAAQAARRTQACARASVPMCGACHTTLYVRDVDSDTNLGLCLRCRAKHWQRPKASLAASYGPWQTRPAGDVNKVY